ncbi:putative mitochondrial beta-ketoacyl-CoA synthase,beta-ketoacyl-coenzyme A [Leptomonas pyrrhocoris]|uniref:Elongation of fatty acids protein n=1 Tax=Leptomonas pyrrhocoris TaxID=157538 RepID=A0A0N0DTB0_LEPPY|nr:putative mitochondrial beta-ketoacyl-CoA synthase,beta-ketoacyl-coenzyme A [Leptomonas pyrrhocoris]XP_015655677.1 putative mitochondrial beta-ketoacyl-CoA synthase,beta-ketoacyl-coenzyme A [Leptomonas pyrrhocoris]KPA77237.1 putative mitochondrial beta-ketoacyl-CoA synthase,beta-ketoacyl-coenzyme A [Leptomonas pyrrhocoris]KPA77238.1 putative mitochondrial beta-ketoacyl-CoA synthase,beta-ketoacyl-coenzyme A [Leptomonas pyrrhocoris]|eukprot:XP_015655676.1 putative mitochondrial beta-ketoacyl-CoA synthase,beta-ketoacyl-coenzyme A [Leptomonas pyrrhocoris]
MQWLDNYGDHQYDGRAVRRWLEDNVDVCVYIAGAYLAFVFTGPKIMEALFHGNPPLGIIKKCWALWNVSLSVFSMYGVLRVGPPVVRSLSKRGLHDSLCTFREEEFYTTKVGFALGMFAISKVPEFMDTVFLLMRGVRLSFLSWFHHVTTFLFAWYSYQQGTSIFILAAAMNYFVHSIMYAYFALSEAGYKNLVKPFAMYITLLQITQMVGGLFVSSYVVYQKVSYGESACSGTSMSAGRTQLVIYIFNFYLFSEMFVKGYILPRKAPAPRASTSKKTA